MIVRDYTYLTMSVTMIVSFLCALYFWKKTLNENIENFKNSRVFSIICLILASFVIFEMYQTKGIQSKMFFDRFIFNPFRIRGFMISLLSALYIGIYIGNKIKIWLSDFYKKMDSWDKKVYLILSLISIGIIVLAYGLNSNWYIQSDNVYSLDSGLVFSDIYPDPSYYHIKHPIMGIFNFPVYAIIKTIVNLLIPGTNITNVLIAIISQILNIQMLIIIGFLLKFLTNKKSVFLIYMLSFPTLSLAMFFEKYILCVFWLVFYLYYLCNKDENKSIVGIISAVGCMPTSCFIGALEFFTSSKMKEKILRILKIIIITILIFICFGRFWVLLKGPSETLYTQQEWESKDFDIKQRMIATLKVIQNSIFALPSKIVAENNYFWDDTLSTNISVISLIIFTFVVIGIIKNRKSLFVKGCTIWTIFSFILFIIFKWSPHTSPLFTIYFSWAIIPLFVMGLEYVFDKLKINKKTGYVILMFLMLVVNITTMLDISKFLAILK